MGKIERIFDRKRSISLLRYMGHPYRFTGLYKTSKYDSRFHLYRFRHSVEIGWTWFNEKEIDQIINGLKPFYRGLDYHTTKKNSIHFAKYLLEQLSNDFQLKHHQPSTIVQFPSCNLSSLFIPQSPISSFRH